MNKHRCKHLCCREGLDKPPKPSKRQTAAAGETSQLTISASLAGRERPATQKKTQNTAAIDGNNSSSGGGQRKTQASTQLREQDGGKKEDVRSVAQRSLALQKRDLVDGSMRVATSQSSSSDYDLSGIISPSLLLEEAAALNDDDSDTRSIDKMTGDDKEDKAMDEEVANNPKTSQVDRNGANQSGMDRQSDLEYWVPLAGSDLYLLDDADPSPSSNIGARRNDDAGGNDLQGSTFTASMTSGPSMMSGPSPAGREVTAAPTVLKGNASGGELKRKLVDDSQAQAWKIAKNSVFDAVPTAASLETHSTAKANSTSATKYPALSLLLGDIPLKTPSPWSASNVPPGWEDVDPALIEEFKDYVNFV